MKAGTLHFLMSKKVVHLKIPKQYDPFCALLVRTNKTMEHEQVVRLREPLCIILGLDELTTNYVINLSKQYNKLEAVKESGFLLDRIVWRDNMPRVCVAASDPDVQNAIGTLTGQPVVLMEGIAPCESAKVDDMELIVDRNGVSWTFSLEGSHYHSESIPVSVFTTALERYSRKGK